MPCAASYAQVSVSLFDVCQKKAEDIILPNPRSDSQWTGVLYVRISTPEDLGDLAKIRIWHDNSRETADWLLDNITIKNTKTQQSWYFPANRWLCEKPSGACPSSTKTCNNARLSAELLPAGGLAGNVFVELLRPTVDNLIRKKPCV